MKKLLFWSVFVIFYHNSHAQIGGQNVFTALQLPHTARVTALGGNLISVADDDVALAYANPALLNASMSGEISFNHAFYFADIQHGYIGYGQQLKSLKMTTHAGLQYIRYGDFQATDPTGQITGTFSASEYAFTLGAARQYSERLRFGANAKLLYANYESYQSLGIAADVAAVYQDTARRFTAALVFKNIGTQLTTFQPDQKEKLPFDVQFALSKQLKYLPFRFSVIVHNLHRWNIRYDDPNADDPDVLFGDGSTTGESNPFLDIFFRHFIFNGEFLLGKTRNFRLRLGYNHLRRAELSLPNTVSLAGFGFGVGLKIKQFRLDYGRGIYHLAGGYNHLTLSTNFADFKR